MRLSLRRTDDRAVLPSRAHDGDVGYDVSSVQHGRINPGETVAVDTGWAVDGFNHALLPYDTFTVNNLIAYAKIEQRSGLALKSMFAVGGVIDTGYRGQLKVLLFNGGQKPYDINIGDRIGQLVFYVVSARSTAVVESRQPQAADTERGSSGLGSTGR